MRQTSQPPGGARDLRKRRAIKSSDLERSPYVLDDPRPLWLPKSQPSPMVDVFGSVMAIICGVSVLAIICILLSRCF